MKKTVTTPFFSDSTLDAARNSTGELGNHAIDEFKAGRLSRRELLRHASLLGLSTAALAAGG
ncbi:ABC transporter substrate-binding protein, partial [Caballeronia sp. M23-90]